LQKPELNVRNKRGCTYLLLKDSVANDGIGLNMSLFAYDKITLKT